jgi:outer membrane lipoprotein-sorting protein
MKLSLTLLAAAALAALPACTQQAEDSVANQFQNTENAIENTAATFESEAENATRAAEAALENQADAVENRIDAIDVVPSNKAGNSQ